MEQNEDEGSKQNVTIVTLSEDERSPVLTVADEILRQAQNDNLKLQCYQRISYSPDFLYWRILCHPERSRRVYLVNDKVGRFFGRLRMTFYRGIV